MKLNILGKIYNFKRVGGNLDDSVATSQDIMGECRYYKKEIAVYDKITPIDYEKFIIRHEIIHAFLFELGNEKQKTS